MCSLVPYLNVVVLWMLSSRATRYLRGLQR